jgi:hypothetical protein
MKRGLIGAVLWMSASALWLNGTAEHAVAQAPALAKSKGWAVEPIVNPATLKAAGNKPILLVFR